MIAAYNATSLEASNIVKKEAANLTLTSIRTMNELSHTLPCARRAVEVVTSLRREWQNKQASFQKRKRVSESEGTDHLSEAPAVRQR